MLYSPAGQTDAAVHKLGLHATAGEGLNLGVIPEP
jgi:hypothetical protein